MSKFGLLIVLVSLCVALSTATWTITGPGATVHIGSLFSLSFTSDEALTADEPTVFKLGFAFLSDIAVAPSGGRLWCTDSASNKLAYWSLDNTNFSIFPLEDTSAPVAFSCAVRMHPSPSGSAYTIAPPTDLGETLTLAGISAVSWKFGMESSVGSLKVILANVPPYTLVGPINHYLSFPGTERNVNSQISPQLYNSDFNSDLGSDFRLLATGATTFYALTDQEPTSSASYRIDYPAVETVFPDNASSYGKKYSYTISAPLANGQKIEDSDEVGEVGIPNNLGTASITMTEIEDSSNFLVTYVFDSIYTDVDSPVVDFSFDGFSVSEIFNSTSTLGYQVDDEDLISVTPLPDNLSLTLTDISKEKFFKVIGTFISSEIKPCGVSFSSGFSSGDAEFGPLLGITDLSITAGSNDQVFFNFKVAAVNGWETYTDSISFSRDFDLTWLSPKTEFRAKNAFTPECTSANLSLSVSSKVASSVDPDKVAITLSGTLETGSTSYDVSCKQLVNDRKKSTDKVEVKISGVSTSVSTSFSATWDLAEAIPDLNQQIIVRGASIQSSGDQEDVLAAVITAINEIPSLSGVSITSLYFQSNTAQHYGDYNNGWELEFDNNIAYYSNRGSYLTLVCARAVDSEAIDVDIFLDDFQISIISKSVTGAPIAPVYLNGESSDYKDAPLVVLGLNVDCWSTKQCQQSDSGSIFPSMYCYRNTCSPQPLLSRSAQVVLGLVSENDAITAWTTFAVVIAFVALLF